MLSLHTITRLNFVAAILCGSLTSWTDAADWDCLAARGHHVELDVSGKDAEVAVRTTGTDPYVIGQWRQKLSADDRVLEFEYFCPAGVTQFSAFVGPPFSEQRHAPLPDLLIAEGWQRYTADLLPALKGKSLVGTTQLRLDFGTTADLRIRLRGVHLRPLDAAETQAIAQQAKRRAKKRAQAEQISDYLQQTAVTKFDRILLGSETVSLQGSIPPGSDCSSWRLVEYRPHHSIDQPGTALESTLEHSEGRFHVVVPRRDGGYDRLFSGWRIRDANDRDLTPRQFATVVTPAADDHPQQRLIPASPKGLSGMSHRGPLEDIPALGVKAVTINLVLNRFLSSTPGPGKQEIDAAGAPVYFDANAFGGYDSLLEFARNHELVVSAIVLIPRSKNATSPLIHPESDGGVYAMPDISTERGVAIYAYVLNKIAQRYRNPQQSPGGITNWIAHNEVDFHPVWTNMGPQPPEVFTEAYYRSLRMISHATRNHNPHARVFASLTHHWFVADRQRWDRLAPREFIETLTRYSRLEGELPWGIAYHPYPESLFAKHAWQDNNVRSDFETPLITMQNIEVLGQFLGQPSMRDAHGRMRPVLLSEQGYHSENYEPLAQANQAGSLSYAMQKVRQHPWIESFHYHRWIDHPDEGGLLLGLRTLPTPAHPHGVKKRSWYVYQAIGTAAEVELTDALPRAPAGVQQP